jgi:hypothetical protein
MSTDVLKVSGNYILDARNGDVTINVTNQTTEYTGTVTIIGNLDVIGQTTQIESIDSRIKDNILVLNSGETNEYVTLGTSGILIARGHSDTIPTAATLFYNDNNAWTVDPSQPSTQGIFEFSSALAGSAIQVNAIRIDTASTSTLNILGADNPAGMINVIGTTNYENRVIHDDDIPNKKYVDLAVYSGSDVAKRLLVGQTTMRIIDSSLPFSDPYYSPSSKIYASIDTSTNIVFRLEGTEAQIQGITINDNTIQVNNLSSDLILQPPANQSVKIESSLKLQKLTTGAIDSIVAEDDQDTLYYSGQPGGGGTGIYFVNTSQRDELVSRRRAIIFGIIF